MAENSKMFEVCNRLRGRASQRVGRILITNSFQMFFGFLITRRRAVFLLPGPYGRAGPPKLQFKFFRRRWGPLIAGAP